MLVSAATIFLQGLGIIKLTSLAHELSLQMLSGTRQRTLAVTVIFSLATLVTMSLPFVLDNGLRLDMRNAFLILAPFFGGPIAALATASVAAAYRMAIGGPAALSGVIGICIAAAVGVSMWRLRPFLTNIWRSAVALGVVACLPLLALLVLPDRLGERAFMEFAGVSLIVNVVGVAIATLILLRRADATKRAVTASHEAETDSLTDLYNERGFQRLAPRLVSKAEEHALPCSILMVHLDGMRSVNEHLGRTARDSVLRKAARVISGTVPQGHLVARVGSQEFAILLLGRDRDQAAILAENIRAAVAAETFDSKNAYARLVVSIGVAVVTLGENAFSETLDRVDAALQSAKRNGRNRVEVAQAA